MLNTQKLLYILPDLTYLAELLPGKKEHEFSIQSFRQINGEFLDENEFISNNIQKLFTKIDKEEYHLILPDFLFTNTIVSVDDETKSGAKKHVKEKLLPDLDLDEKTHEIEVSVLTSFKGESKVQISAIEKEVLAPIRVAASQAGVKIVAVSPISWAIKSIVSLEPSISVLQIGNNLYSSQHYIGVDQTNNFPVSELESIAETIKTLKGAEPSIQTIYLASNALVEESLKESLSGTIPIQQLATYKEDDSKMPSYVKYIIESSMKTLSIEDFPVPNFELGKPTKDEEKKVAAAAEEGNDDKMEKSKETTSSTNPASADLPEPTITPAVGAMAAVEEDLTMPKSKKEEKELETKEVEKEEEKAVEETEEKAEGKEKKVETITIEAPPEEENKEEETEEKEASKEEEKEEKDKKEDDEKEESKEEKVEEKETKKVEPLSVEDSDEDSDDSESESSGLAEFGGDEESNKKDDDEVNLNQFAGKEEESEEDKESKEEEKEKKEEEPEKEESSSKSDKKEESSQKPQKVIKNSSGVNNMLKMVFITLAVFFITIAIGVGVGVGLLKMTDKSAPEEEVAPVVVTEPEEEVMEEASESAETMEEEIVVEDLSILVVNATTKAGYAGQIKAALLENELTDVTAGNAEGEYQEGADYLLMAEENAALQSLLEDASELEFEYSSEVDVEDPDGDYDAVIVLAQ